MKVLYIPSGYARIYHYLDQSIMDAWKTVEKTKLLTVKSPKNIAYLKRTICNYKPDLIMTVLGDHLSQSFMEWMKSLSIPSILWLTEDPYHIDRSIQQIPYFNFIFTIDSGAHAFYKEQNINRVYFLPLGTNPNIYQTDSINRKIFSDLCMVGYPYPNRIELIKLLIMETDFTINLVGPSWDKHIPVNSQVYLYKKWLNPPDVAEFYRSCKIVLNTCRPFDEKSNTNSLLIKNRSVNNRTFDIASSQGFQLTQFIDDLPSFFEEKKEITSFKTPDEFLEKVNMYINNEALRKGITYNAYKKVIKHHTFNNRLNEMLKIIKGKMDG
jgi:spore maturation protein CgeB